MALLPRTVGELRRFLETYPDDLPVFIQGDTQRNPNATPENFVIEYWDDADSENNLLLLAGLPFISSIGTEADHENARNMAAEYTKNNPNASWNNPK